MADYTLKAPCAQCDGAGTVQVWVDGEQTGTETCPMCNGTTRMTIGSVEFGDNIVRSDQVRNATKASEYNALSDNNKERYKLVLTGGLVDLSDGTNDRAAILAMFDAESESRASILALIGE